jgi:molecular chaperone GrpE
VLHDRPDDQAPEQDAREGPPPGGATEPAGDAPDAATGTTTDQDDDTARGDSPAPTDGGRPAERGGAGPADDTDRTAQALAEAERLTADLTGQLRRALADLDNLRKRYQRELTRERAAQRSEVAAAWLPVVDDLDRALQHAGADATALVDGVTAVRDQALALLNRLGFPRYEDIGQPFDPARHEAVATVVSDAPTGSVVATARPGYGTGERILRPAGVVVARDRD